MHLRRSVLSLLSPAFCVCVLTSLVGCAPEPKPLPPAPPPPPSSSQTANMRSAFLKINPDSLIGTVARVRPADSMAAVSGIPLDKLRTDDAIIFTDAANHVVARGTVNSKSENGGFLIVKYEISAGGRAPVEGDAACHLPVE